MMQPIDEYPLSQRAEFMNVIAITACLILNYFPIHATVISEWLKSNAHKSDVDTADYAENMAIVTAVNFIFENDFVQLQKDGSKHIMQLGDIFIPHCTAIHFYNCVGVAYKLVCGDR